MYASIHWMLAESSLATSEGRGVVVVTREDSRNVAEEAGGTTRLVGVTDTSDIADAGASAAGGLEKCDTTAARAAAGRSAGATVTGATGAGTGGFTAAAVLPDRGTATGARFAA